MPGEEFSGWLFVLLSWVGDLRLMAILLLDLRSGESLELNEISGITFTVC